MDKRNECVIDFYQLIDTIDIKQIRFTNPRQKKHAYARGEGRLRAVGFD